MSSLTFLSKDSFQTKAHTEKDYRTLNHGTLCPSTLSAISLAFLKRKTASFMASNAVVNESAFLVFLYLVVSRPSHMLFAPKFARV